MSHIPQVIFLTFIRSKSKYWICRIEEITISLFRNLQTKAKSLEKFFLDCCHIINLLYRWQISIEQADTCMNTW